MYYVRRTDYAKIKGKEINARNDTSRWTWRTNA